MTTKAARATSSSDSCLFAGLRYKAQLCLCKLTYACCTPLTGGVCYAEKEKTGTLFLKSLKSVGKVKPPAPK